MFVEDLPMSGFIGDVVDEDVVAQDIMGTGSSNEGKTYLFPHLSFSFGTNQNRIVSASVKTDPTKKVDITNVNVDNLKVQFTYSVDFFPDSVEWKHRMRRYSHSMFAPRSSEIHWLSIVNSCVLVLLLVVFMVIIFMRILKNDITNYIDLEEETVDEEEVRFLR